MSRNRMFLGIVLIGVIGIVIAYSFLSFKPKNLNPFSAESAKADGVKALYLLYEKRGLKVAKWDAPYQDLPPTADETLMIIWPQTSVPTGQEWKALEGWVKRGNQVVIWGPTYTKWGESFQFEGKVCEPLYIEKRQVREHEQNPWLKQMKSISWKNECLEPSKWVKPVLTDEHGNLLVAKRFIGKGAVYYVPDAYLVINQQIALADHVALPLGLVKKQKVWFDQSVHTLSNESSNQLPFDQQEQRDFFSLLEGDGLLLMIQLILIMMLWLYARGKRFAAPRFEMVKDERNALEYVEAIAKWYVKSAVRRDALTTQFQTLREQMREAFRLSASQHFYEGELKKQITRYLGASFLTKYDELVQTMHKMETKKRISAKEFIQVSREIDTLRKEIIQWRTTLPQRVSKK